MGDFINEIGNKYGELIVIDRGQDYIRPSGGKEIRWVCKCSCGNEILVFGYKLRNRKLATCGHCNNIHVGDKFGHLTVISESERSYYPNTKKQASVRKWICACDCRNHTIVEIRDCDLKNGKTKSCRHCKDLWPGDVFGHLTVIDKLDDRITPYKIIPMVRCICDCAEHNIVDIRSSSLTSGATKSCGNCKGFKGYMYLASHYFNMISRCYNPNDINYYNYGAIGISVCDEWTNDYNGFINFRNWSLSNGYRQGLTIDRINPYENYCPENCRWADNITQSNNKRNSKKILYNNEYYSIAEIARATGISKSLLYKRNNDGVPLINKNDTIKGIYFVNEFGNVINDPID